MQRRTVLSTLVSTGTVGVALPTSKVVWAQTFVAAVLPPQKFDAVTRQLRFALTLSNPQSNALYNQTLWMYMPVKRSSAQDMLTVDTKAPHELHMDALGHSLLKIQLAELAPLTQRIFSVTVRISLHSPPRPIELGDAKDWLQTEAYTEVSDNRMQAHALQLKGISSSQTARNIYDWVASNIAYAGYIADDLGALYALTERKGDCTEYAFLVVALARANQIPARMVGGYVTDRDTTPRADEYHNWAELYLDGVWQIVDAQKKNWLMPSEQYIAFRYYRGAAINPVGSAHRYKIIGDMQVRI